MAVDVAWYDDMQTILLITYRGEWTMDDLYAMVKKSALMTENSESYVVITDFSRSSMIPNGFLSIGRRIEQTNPPHQLMIILIQPNMMAQILIKALIKIYPKIFGNAHIVPDMDEALTAARERLKIS